MADDSTVDQEVDDANINQDIEMDETTGNDNMDDTIGSDKIEDELEGPQDVGGFTVLGEFKAKEKKKVCEVLRARDLNLILGLCLVIL